MSAPWQSTAGASGRPSLPAGAIAQANAAPPATPIAGAQAAASQLQGAFATAVGANGNAKTVVNGSAPSAAPVVPVRSAIAAQQAVPVNQNGKRELSPDRAAGGSMPPSKTIKSTHNEDVKPSILPPQVTSSTSAAPATPSVQFLPMARGQGIDLRAEEEAQRRAARTTVPGVRYTGPNRAKQTDLFGERALRMHLHQIAQEHAMTVDEEAMRYLALAAEVRVRSLLASAIRAQEHRVSSTHKYAPPMHAGASGAPRPLWSQNITSDPNAVLAALEASNKEETKAHRIARTEWKARETELARAAAAARDREEGQQERDGGQAAAAASPAATNDAGASGSTPTASASTKAPTFQATPTFGAPPPKKTKSKKAGKDVSEAVEHRMTNRTAQAFFGRKQYAWETGGSPASWKTKKNKKKEEEGAAAAEVVKPKRVRRRPSSPKPREIDVAAPGDKKSNDKQALTLADMLFALEHDGERGMGSSEEVARRMWLRPGGPYGSGR